MNFDEIYQFDGTTETPTAGVTSALGAGSIEVTDTDPPDGTEGYCLEVLRAAP